MWCKSARDLADLTESVVRCRAGRDNVAVDLAMINEAIADSLVHDWHLAGADMDMVRKEVCRRFNIPA
jgi:hypothetical protein